MAIKNNFYINNIKHVNGPSIFGLRLKDALVDLGWNWNRFLPSISFIVSSGTFRPFGKNILRLDGLYFDLANTLGDSDKKNKPLIKAYKKTDGIIFQSKFSQQLFANFFGSVNAPNIIIPNGAPSSFSAQGASFDYGYKKILICAADWREHKRLSCIIDGFLEYGDADSCLAILGKNAGKKTVHPNIKYLGHQSPDDLPYYLRGADAFIHLSWLENCPNTVVEALCCGLPVLCTHNGGTKEIVRDNGIIIKCEENFEFKKVNLYDPPKCDKRTVAEAIDKILSWDKPVNSDYLQIKNVAAQYADFAISLV